MPIDITGTGNYSGILTANAGLENRLYFFQYSPLESQLNQIQPLQEPEDPPETMHTPWGIWRHWRDPLHSIDERFDAEHIVRRGRAAEDILHNAHYVPVIGDHDHKEKAYEMNLEYDDPAQLEVYNSKINLKYSAEMDFEEGIEDQNTKISINTETEDDSIDSEEKNIGEKPEEPNSGDRVRDRAQKNNFDLEYERELTKIFEEYIKNSAESGGF